MKSENLLTTYLLGKYDLDCVKNILLENHIIRIFDTHPFLLDENIKNTIRCNTYLRKFDLLTITQISDVFSNNNIRHLFFKGLPLSQYLYDDPFLRMSADIDLYVYGEDFDKAYDILKQNGFWHTNEQGYNSEHHIVLGKNNLLLELHRNILSPFTRIDESFLLNRQGSININGKNISTFDITATITHLIYHLYMDTWLTPTDFFSLLTTKNIVKANKFLYRAYEIALFSEKYFDEIAWAEVINDIKKQPFRIMFKGMIDDILEIFPEAFPEQFINAIHGLDYDDTVKFVFFDHLLETNVLPEQIDSALSCVIDTNWLENANEKIKIHHNGDFVLTNAIVRDAEANANYQFVCRVNVEKTCNDVKIEFKISNDDFCFSNSGEYNTQNSDGVHLMICGTEKYSYNSIFLFPKFVNGKMEVVPVDVLNDVNREIDNTYIRTAYEAAETEYTLVAVLKEKFLRANSLQNGFYLGLVVSNCSSKTQKRKSELVLTTPHWEWFNPIYFAKIELE